jgi:hypothetical protein
MRQVLFDFKSKELNQSFVADKEVLKKRAKEIRDKKLGKLEKLFKDIKKSSYFVSLFPLVKEQKPGRDLYAHTTVLQFIICFYMINYYSYLDSRGT